MINCDASYDMALNQANIRLTCMVQARPIPSDVSFFLEQTQHTIRADGVTHSDANAYATMVSTAVLQCKDHLYKNRDSCHENNIYAIMQILLSLRQNFNYLCNLKIN